MRHKMNSLQARLREPSLVVFLIAQLVMIFGLGPLLSLSPSFPINMLVLLFVAATSFVAFVSHNLVAAGTVISALCLSVLAVAMRQMSETDATDWLGAAGGFLAVGSVSWLITKTVFAPGRMSGFRVLGAVILYLNFAILFFILFRLIAERAPGAFSGIPSRFNLAASFGDLMYFSVATLTTVGYGDITPMNPFARSLSNLEAIIGQLYPAIILARMITLYTPKDRSKPSAPESIE
jgi:voltage-gated potassium channel Kch